MLNINKTAIRLTITISFFMDSLDATVINTSFPQMAFSLHVAPLHLKVALTAYLLSLGIFIPISGWIADRYGTQRTYATAMIIFMLGSLFCALAPNVPFLVMARVLQGMGGAMMTPVGRLILLKTFERQEMVSVMSKITSIALIAPVLGPVVGGAITTYLSWHWIFLINLPLGCVGLWAIIKYIPQCIQENLRAFDWRGFLILGLSLVLLLSGFQNVVANGLNQLALLILCVGAVLLSTYVFYMKKVPHAIVSSELLRVRVFRITLFSGFIMRIGLGVAFILPLLFQLGYGYNALVSGLMIVPLAFGAILMKPCMKPLLKRFGYKRVLIANTLWIVILVACMNILTLAIPIWTKELFILVYGFAISMNFGGTNTLLYSDVEGRLKSQATSVGAAMQQVAISFGVAFVAVVLELVAQAHDLMHSIPLFAFRITFIAMACVVLCSLFLFRQLKSTDGAHLSQHGG